VKKLLIICFALVAATACQKKSGKDTPVALPAQVVAAESTIQNLGVANDEVSNSRRNAITRAVERISPAVVGINVTQMRRVYSRSPFSDDPFFRQFFDLSPYTMPVKSLGSGFLISADGKILTNQHVVDEADEIIVTLVDGSHHKAKVIGHDYVTDIALLQMEGEAYPFVEFGNSEDVIIGEWAIAIGNPFGLFDLNAKPTVTVGVISATGQNFGRQENRRIYQSMLQTDASINQGNSGGPLANALGQVIGINTFIFTGGTSGGSIGLGFAIPINRVKSILRELEQHGQVNRRYYTGLEVQNLTPFLARYLQLQSARGVIVTGVEERSPAARANVRVGDVILLVNGERVTNTQDIITIIETADLRAGDKLNLRVNRNGRELDLQVRLEDLPN
jgi:serine protease Do